MTAAALPYDTLVLATGARHAYFGHDEWEPFAPGLKTLEDATTLRRRILVAFERAERETDPQKRAALLTFVIIGAGPTGVEWPAPSPNSRSDTLPPRLPQHRYAQGARRADRGGHRACSPAFPTISRPMRSASLESIGVEVMLGQPVTECSADGVVYGGNKLRGAHHHLGRRRARLARRRMAGRAGRPRRPPAGRSLTSPCPAIPTSSRSATPSRSPAPTASRCRASRRPPSNRDAMSPMRSRRGLQGSTLPPFRYKHAGSLAQIGKRKAVIDFGRDQAARHAGVVDLGHRPHLFPDRPAQPAQRRA